MYAKVFTQIFDSSIAEDYKVRHVFEDLLKLCDRDGVVDMTPEAIARRTNVPLEEVKYGIGELMKADPRSRSHEYEGRRIILVDSHRDWGWQIVSYQYYRQLRDEEARRMAYRDAKRKQREKQKKQVLRNGRPLNGEPDYVSAVERGAGEAEQNRIVSENLPMI